MEKKYNFYGWETANISPTKNPYINNNLFKNPKELYDVLSELWSEETCAPRMRKDWNKENKTLGQCSITSFLVQDIFGGKVYGYELPDGNFHCYNVIGDCKFDLTSEQFNNTNQTIVYENNPEQLRENHFKKEEKKQRYEILKKELNKKMGL